MQLQNIASVCWPTLHYDSINFAVAPDNASVVITLTFQSPPAHCSMNMCQKSSELARQSPCIGAARYLLVCQRHPSGLAAAAAAPAPAGVAFFSPDDANKLIVRAGYTTHSGQALSGPCTSCTLSKVKQLVCRGQLQLRTGGSVTQGSGNVLCT